MPTQSFAPTFLLTRPDAQSLRLASQLHQAFPDIATVVSPVLQPVYFTPPLPGGRFGAVIFTSQAAVQAAATYPTAVLPKMAYCVGPTTEAEAKRSGFETRAAQGDLVDLIRLILADAPKAPLLYLRGTDITGDIAASLHDHGVQTQSLVVYQQVEQPLTAKAATLLSGDSPVILPVFSKRSAVLLRKKLAAPPRRCPIWGAALSPAIAQEMDAIGCERSVTASNPSNDALIFAITQLIGRSPA